MSEAANGGEAGNPPLLLQAEVCSSVFRHLDAAAMVHVSLSCRHYADILSNEDEWRAWLNSLCDMPAHPPLEPPLTLRQLALAVGAALMQGPEVLASNVIGASSVDQDVEDASNVLRWSECAPDVRGEGAEGREGGGHRSAGGEGRGGEMRPQCRCNPACGERYRPCYWSSLPTEDKQSSEWIWVKLRGVACLVGEVSLYPYEAYWQPRDSETGGFPVYSPQALRWEFGRFGEVPEGGEGEVWASTERVEVPHGAEGKRLRLGRPLLALGGECRVCLLGRVQRQTFEDLGEYYTCVQHLSIAGWRLGGLRCGSTQGGGWGLAPSGERHCAMCGGFRGGTGSHRASKLFKCGFCRAVSYCSKECQRRHWRMSHKAACSGGEGTGGGGNGGA